MAEDGNELRPGDETLAALIAGGMSYIRAAAKHGVDEKTVRRRMQTPVFRRLVEDIRAAVVEQAIARMGASMTKAVRKLHKLIDSNNEAISLGACRSVIELHTRVHDMAVMNQRLEEVKSRMDKLLAGRKGKR